MVLCVAPASGQPCPLTLTYASAPDSLDTARSRCLQRSQFIEDAIAPCFLPGIISLFIMYVEIIWHNSLVGGCARAGVWTLGWSLNPGHLVCHSLQLLYMVPKWFDHCTGPHGQVCSDKQTRIIVRLLACLKSTFQCVLRTGNGNVNFDDYVR